VHPLVMGLEEHLLHMFRDDFEFSDEAGASHLGGHSAAPQPGASSPAPAPIAAEAQPLASTEVGTVVSEIVWAPDAEAELRKIPFFVRGKARRNTERFAVEQGLATIGVETLYDAKSHYSR
jgi:light-independent protochlorophyllide reductase subunit B